jgi:hypothetical protein
MAPGSAEDGGPDSAEVFDLLAPGTPGSTVPPARSGPARKPPPATTPEADRAPTTGPEAARAQGSAGSAPAVVPPSRVPSPTGRPQASGPRGVGLLFYPLAGVPMVRPAAAYPLIAEFWVPADSEVHAIAAGRLHMSEPGVVAIGTELGLTLTYTGLRVGAEPATVSGQVHAGVVIGHVEGEPGSVSLLKVAATAPDGSPVNAVELVVGLPDPAELGYADTATGELVDPDGLDQELIASGQEWWPAGRPPP